MKQLAIFAALLLGSGVLLGCKPAQDDAALKSASAASTQREWKPEVDTNSSDAKAYKGELVAAIISADRIVLVEHSTPFDYVDKATGDTDSLPSAIYGAVRLSEAQREAFITSIRNVPNETSNWGLACVFNAHHSFFFYSKSALTSRMDVCFHCGEVKWNGTKHYPPLHLTDGLAKVVTGAGLSPEREWEQLLAAVRSRSVK